MNKNSKRFNNLYGILTVDDCGNSDADGERPWKLQSDLTFSKRVLREGVVICTLPYLNTSSRYLEDSKRIILVDTNIPNSLEMVLEPVKYSTDISYYVFGDSSLYRILEPYISKWYISNVETGGCNISSSDYFPNISNQNWDFKVILEVEDNKINQYPFTVFKYEFKDEKTS